MLNKLFLTLCFSLLLHSAAHAHKYYTSITQVEYNAKTRSAEVIMNLYTDDLEKVLSNRLKRKVKSSDINFKALTYQYIDSQFQLITANQKICRNEYAGLEFNRDMVSIYFEIPLPSGLNGNMLKQSTFLDLYPEQTNIVNLMNGKKKTSMIFKSGSVLSQLIRIS